MVFSLFVLRGCVKALQFPSSQCFLLSFGLQENDRRAVVFNELSSAAISSQQNNRDCCSLNVFMIIIEFGFWDSRVHLIQV